MAKFLTIESITSPLTTTTKVRGLVKTQRAVSTINFQAFWQEFSTPVTQAFLPVLPAAPGSSTIRRVIHKQTSAWHSTTATGRRWATSCESWKPAGSKRFSGSGS